MWNRSPTITSSGNVRGKRKSRRNSGARKHANPSLWCIQKLGSSSRDRAGSRRFLTSGLRWPLATNCTSASFKQFFKRVEFCLPPLRSVGTKRETQGGWRSARSVLRSSGVNKSMEWALRRISLSWARASGSNVPVIWSANISCLLAAGGGLLEQGNDLLVINLRKVFIELADS